MQQVSVRWLKQLPGETQKRMSMQHTKSFRGISSDFNDTRQTLIARLRLELRHPISRNQTIQIMRCLWGG